MNSLYKTLNTQQATEMKKILTRLRGQTKNINEYIERSYSSCRNCRMDTIWNQLKNQFDQLYVVTKTTANYTGFTVDEVRLFYQNGNRLVSKLQSIATQMLIELSDKKNSTTLIRVAANETERIINALMNELEVVIVEFNTINTSFVQKNTPITNTPTLNNLNNSFTTKQEEKKFEALIAERQQNLKKTHKQRENKIKEEERKQRELLTQQILKHENEAKANRQRIRTLEDTILRQRTQEQNFNEERRRLYQISQTQKLQNDQLKKQLKTQQQRRLRLQDQKRLKIQEQQEKQKNLSQKQKKQLQPLQQNINSKKQQLKKLQEEVNRIRSTIQLTKKQSYELKGKKDQLEKVTGEMMMVSRFVEMEVNQRLMSMIGQLNQVTGDKKFNVQKDNMNGSRKNNELLINAQPTRDLQENLLNLLNNVESLTAQLKHQFTQVQAKLSSSSKQLTSLQNKLQSSSTTVTSQRQQYLAKQKQLKQLQRKYQTFVTYESLLQANRQQSRKYEQLNYKIQQRTKAYDNEKHKIQNLNQQYNMFLKERFRDACNIQQLQSRIEQLTREKNHISQTVEKKYHNQVSFQTNQKQLEVQNLADSLSRKEFQVAQLLNEDKKNKIEISKLTKELQEMKKSYETERQRMIEKLNQYEFKVNRLLEEKQQFLLKLNHSSGNSMKIEHKQDPQKQSIDQLFKPKNKQLQIRSTSTSTKNSRIKQPHIKSSSQQTSFTPQQRLQQLIQQNQSLQEKISNLNSELSQIKQKIHNLNRELSQSSSGPSQNQSQKIQELECQYEEKQKMISFCQETIRNNQTQILKLKKSLK